MAVLELELPGGQRQAIATTAIIGRSSDCLIVIEDPEASRHHAQITIAEAGPTIEDLGSRNGTFVNGDRVLEGTRLSDGDEIAIGNTSMWVRMRVEGREGDTVIAPAVATQLFVPAVDVELPGWFVTGGARLATVIGDARRLYDERRPFHLYGPAGSGRTALARALHEAGDGGGCHALDCRVHTSDALASILLDESDGLLAGPVDSLVVIAHVAAMEPAVQSRLAGALEGEAGPRVVTTGLDRLSRLGLDQGLTAALGETGEALPPLAERSGDFTRIATSMAGQRAAALGLPAAFSPKVMETLDGGTYRRNLGELGEVLTELLLVNADEPGTTAILKRFDGDDGADIDRTTLAAGGPQSSYALAALAAAADIGWMAADRLAAGGVLAIPALIEAIDAPSIPAARRRQIAALARLADERCVPYLLRLTEDEDRACRAAAVLALGATASPAAESRLAELAGEPDHLTAAAAIVSLGRSPDAVTRIVAAGDRSESVRLDYAVAAAMGSAARNGGAPQDISERLAEGKPVPQPAIEAALASGSIERDEVGRAALRTEARPEQRRILVAALASTGTPESAGELVTLIRDTLDARMRNEIVAAIARTEARAAPVIAAIVAEPQTRPLGLEIVGALVHPETTLRVVQLLAPQILVDRSLRHAIRGLAGEILGAFLARPEEVRDAETLGVLLSIVPGPDADTEQRRRDVTRALQTFQ